MVEKAFEIPDKLFCETEHALIRSLCLMDENYMAKTFTEYPECMELILRILLDKPDLSITRIEINEIEESRFKKTLSHLCMGKGYFRFDLSDCISKGLSRKWKALSQP